MAIPHHQISFGGGMLDELYVHRQIDMPPYAIGARESLNGIILASGAWTRRPGTYIKAATYQNRRAWLYRWEYNRSDCYLLEFTPYALRFYRNGELVTSGSSPYVIDTPFEESELRYLQVDQRDEILWITSGQRYVYKLTRIDNASWQIEPASLTSGPFGTPNKDTNIYLAVDVVNVPGTAVVVTATGGSPFNAARVGSLLRLDAEMQTRRGNQMFTATGESTEKILCTIGMQWYLTVWAYGGTQAHVRLEESTDGTVWRSYRDVEVEEYEIEEIIGVNGLNRVVYLRVNVISYTGSNGVRCVWGSYPPTWHSGVILLDEYVDSTIMKGVIVTEPVSTDGTNEWAFGAIGSIPGYPRCLTVHDGRLVLGKLTEINASSTRSFEDFTEGLQDDDAYRYQMDASVNQFNWLRGGIKRPLIAGTEKAIVELGTADSRGATPTNILAPQRILAFPTARMTPILVQDAMIVPGGDRLNQLFEIVHSEERGGMVAGDLNQFSREVAGGGFIGLAVQLGIQNILWLPTDAGVAGCTYLPGMPAWYKATFGDEVVSACTIPTDSGEQLWLCVRRGTDYFIEAMGLIDLDAEVEDSHYVDSGVAWDGGASATINSISLANPALLSLAAWPQDSTGDDLADGDTVRIVGYADMEGQVYQVTAANKAAKLVRLKDQSGTIRIDSSAFAAYTGGATLEWVRNSITGMGHLDGADLLALCDGAEVACVDAATITFGSAYQHFYNTIHVGVEVEASLRTLPLDFYLRSGITAGRPKQIAGLTISLYRSRGGLYGVYGGAMTEIVPDTRTAEQLTGPPPAYTGSLNLRGTGAITQGELTLQIRAPGAYPFTIRALTTQIEV